MDVFSELFDILYVNKNIDIITYINNTKNKNISTDYSSN